MQAQQAVQRIVAASRTPAAPKKRKHKGHRHRRGKQRNKLRAVASTDTIAMRAIEETNAFMEAAGGGAANDEEGGHHRRRRKKKGKKKHHHHRSHRQRHRAAAIPTEVLAPHVEENGHEDAYDEG